MKYFYQQLFGFLSVVLVTISVCGLLFYNVMTRNIHHQKATQLYGYARSIIENQLTYDDISKSLFMLEKENIKIALFDDQENMLYPAVNMAGNSGLSEDELNLLRNGQAIDLKETNQGFTGEKVELVSIFYPIFNQGTFAGFIAIASPLSRLQTELADVRNTILTGFWMSTLVGILISIFFANYQTNRINRLRQAAHAISEGDFDIQLPNKDRDELDDLASDFNLMAESLKESQEEIERQENLRRQFMMDVAHEMRTPLTTMNGLLEGLIHNMIPEKRRGRSLELISGETQRLIRLVNENLDYEKIRSNQIILVKQNFKGLDPIRNVLFQLHDMANSKHNELLYDVAPDFTVYADYDRFVQIVFNLTKNANQFTDNGSIRVKAYNEGQEAIVVVKDNGIGIDAKELDAIWERFYKVDVSRKNNKYGESGIGLSIVQSLVQSHEGSITVESIPELGTTFTVRFPGPPITDGK